MVVVVIAVVVVRRAPQTETGKIDGSMVIINNNYEKTS